MTIEESLIQYKQLAEFFSPEYDRENEVLKVLKKTINTYHTARR